MSNKDTKQNTPTSVYPAGFWKKLMAWIYDLLGGLAVFILAMVVGYLIIYLVTFTFFDNGEQLSKSLTNNPLWSLYLFAAVQYFYVWCWVKGGQTLGMKTWRLKLCKADGSLLSWKEGYIRSLASLGGVAILWSLIDKEKRGLHDLIVASFVVELPKEAKKPQKPLI